MVSCKAPDERQWSARFDDSRLDPRLPRPAVRPVGLAAQDDRRHRKCVQSPDEHD